MAGLPHRPQVWQQNNQRFCAPLTLIVRQGDEGIRATPSLTLPLWEENVPGVGWRNHLASGPSLGHLCPERRCEFSLFLRNQMETITFRLPPPQVLVPGGDDYAHRQCFVASVLEGWGARKELVLGIFKASCKMLPHK